MRLRLERSLGNPRILYDGCIYIRFNLLKP